MTVKIKSQLSKSVKKKRVGRPKAKKFFTLQLLKLGPATKERT